MKRRIFSILLSAVFLLLCGCQAPTAPQTKPTFIVNGDTVFRAAVMERHDNTLTVAPLQGEAEHRGGNLLITFSVSGVEEGFIRAGDAVEITYDGQIMETYPAQIRASAVKKITAPLDVPFDAAWIDQTATESYYDQQGSHDFVITAVYNNCFFATSVSSFLYTYKINGTLDEDWCVGDQVLVTYRNACIDDQLHAEMDLVDIQISDYVPDPYTCAKPVIYLYPETETEVTVNLALDGELTCTYPPYGEGWRVTASPDGTLTDARGQCYNYLYWEGDSHAVFDLSEGFCVKGEDTAAFLEEALEKLGLTRREANEFIVYWLPLMEPNPYNVISFQTDRYTDAAQLNITPAPDTMIRVFMAWQKADSFKALAPQELTTPARNGFTVVEWGGTQIG